ncbi:MAG: BolA family transcriptional regulator [Bdellovibrionaceae bacterium]|nr:BolA family transcriptional regulator [Pseudobdellovibrionaceae bacterium]
MPSIDQILQSRLTETFKPEHLTVLNESDQHSGPATESHYRVTIVSEQFSGQSRVQRSRQVHQALADLMANPIHALSTRLFTPSEWAAKKDQLDPGSPPCASKS